MSSEAASKAHEDGMPHSERFRMSAALALLLFLGFLTTSTISYLISRHSIRNSILEHELPLSSNSIYSEVQRDLFEPILISSLMANDTFVKDWILRGELEMGEINRYLAQIERKYGTTTAFLVSDRTRRYYNRSGVLKVISEENPADKWYFRVRTMTANHEINVDPDLSNHAAMGIFVNFRIVTNDGDYLGATGVGLEVRALKAIMREYRAKFNRDVYFYDRSGGLVLHSLGEDLEPSIADGHTKRPEMREILARSGSGEKEITASSEGRKGELINYRYLPELDWVLVVEQRSDGTGAILLKTIGVNLLICLLVGLVLSRVIQRTALSYQKSLEAKNSELERHRQELEEMNTARERLLTIVGHDLRTPVGNLKSTLDLLSDGDIDAAVWMEFRDDLRRGVNHTLSTLDNLMEWGALQSGPLKQTASSVPLREVAAGAIRLFALAAKRKRVEVINRIPEEAQVRAVSQQLASILRNLLSNAIKFTPEGGTVVFSATREGAGWRVAVTDTGVGIDTGRAQRIFTEGESPTRGTGNEAGYGLGLQLVHDFVHANGGRLEVKSEPGQGAEFFFTLPEAGSAG